MPRSEAEWARWFERREAKKKKTRRKTKHQGSERPSSGMVNMPPFARVIGEPTFFDDSWKRGRISKFADFRRKNPTRAEARLQDILHNLNKGVLRGKFTREHIISGKWIVDFFFHEIRLAVEVDGSIHLVEHQLKRDKLKDADCEEFDITVLRILNSDVFGPRESLLEKLRSGWRNALARKNKIIGLTEQEYYSKP